MKNFKYPLFILILIIGQILLADIDYSQETRGMYLRTDIVNGADFDSLMVKAKAAGINAIVFDIKDMKGRMYIEIEGCRSLISYPGDLKVDLNSMVKKIKDHKMKAIARIVAFHNKRAAAKFMDLCPQDSSGEQWVESSRKGPQWLDPSDQTVQNDLLKLLDLVVESHVDEIQFDYIRFPTQGTVGQARFDFMIQDDQRALMDSTYQKRTKMDIITDFLSRVEERYKKSEVSFAADIFAIVSWQNERDVRATGQDLSRMSKHLDALHPMIYSSHFAKNFGYRDDVHNEPYDIIFQGIKRSKPKLQGNCKLIPYIQANNWQVNYKKEYISAQIEACRNAGADGFVLWNATISYKNTLRWMAELNK